MALAAIYPPALKVAATWFGRGHGLALATLIAALSAGSALPHSLRGLAVNVDWRMILGACSVASLIGSLLFLLAAKNGPLAVGTALTLRMATGFGAAIFLLSGYYPFLQPGSAAGSGHSSSSHQVHSAERTLRSFSTAVANI
jgi:hypothetical protein